MKKLNFILLFAFVLLSFVQCKKSGSTSESPTAISYPATGAYGQNILAMSDNAMVSKASTYSFCANLQSYASLKIVITNLTTGSKAGWFYDVSTNKNWTISNLAQGQQTFTSNNNGLLDLSFSFTADSTGKCHIDFYENSNHTLTRSRTISWH
jgi:hypothetical protein